MSIKTFNPTTPSRRHMTVSGFDGIDNHAKPEASLTEVLKKNACLLYTSIIVFLAGLSLLLYPTVSDYWNSFHASRAVAAYDETVRLLDPDSCV